MGEQNVPDRLNEEQLRAFMRSLLEDVQALEIMLANDMIETGHRRIGAEQEMFVVDRAGRPSPMAMEILAQIADPRFTTELAKFNLEANLEPLDFGGDCLRRMEQGVDELVSLARTGARAYGGRIILTGILPTLRWSDLTLENMTPNPRYFALNREMARLRGGKFHVVLEGLDELEASHDNIMLESCNTSFQIHFQVGPEEFARLYNLAQAVTAPVLAAAVNSPLLLGRRLWKETRVALFEQSVDVRSPLHMERGLPGRVSFGERWVKESVLEIFREDIARFRVVLATGHDENPLDWVRRGHCPPLSALRLHNGTVYRWNRACYGMYNGKAHLRIEIRALPAGPTVVDEVANAAFFFGLMAHYADEIPNVAAIMPFDHAKANFLQAARHGLQAQFVWVDGSTVPARELLLKTLLPKAREGLLKAKLDESDVDRYLGIVTERVEGGRTGSMWALESFTNLCKTGVQDQHLRTLVTGTISRQERGDPVHTWPPVSSAETEDWRESYLTVGQFMTRNVFTVRPQDLIDLAASLMEWEHLKHVPVEDDEGRLVGLVSSRAFLRLVARGLTNHKPETVPIAEIMKTNLVTVSPETPTVEAIAKMREHRVGCLPVVQNERLVGILTEHDFLEVAGKLLEQQLRPS
jgi:CBS domain-containing protein